MSKIVSISRHHHAATVSLENGEIDYFINEERLCRKKYDGIPILGLLKLNNPITDLVVCGFKKPNDLSSEVDTETTHTLYDNLIGKTVNQKQDFRLHNFWNTHHLMHAWGAFYNSGFTKAVSMVFDGSGSYHKDGEEIESHYIMNYPAKSKLLFKKTNKNERSLGTLYSLITEHLGLGKGIYAELNAGKTMGLASYGKPLDIDWDDFLKGEHNLYFNSRDMKDFDMASNVAASLQHYTQTKLLESVKHRIEETGIKNICLSGGYILNCVSNFNLIKNLPKDVNIYIEPVSADNGTALGGAKFVHHKTTNDYTKRPQNTLYYGFKYDNIEDKIKKYKTRKVTKDDVAKILEKEVVAIWQGRSEQGPRALGNRSILFNPRLKDGKDTVNEIKKREWFRPFAGTVLYEHKDKYFDMNKLDESPFMTYAVDVKNKDEIPAITHIDNTCRIQTLKKEFNEHFYELIEAFYKLTGTPILLNTSFNLAGEPMVETIEDALDTLERSKLKYIYLPELNTIIEK